MNANSINSEEDTLKVAASESDEYFIDRSKNIVIGLVPDYKIYKITFRNIVANLMGDLYADYDDAQFANSIITWNFKPSINQFNVSASAVTRYGSFSYSKSIPSGLENQSTYRGFNFAIPYKKLTLSFDYFKFTGINRIEPLSQQTIFLSDMSYTPMHVSLEYFYGRLKNNLLHIPKKSSGALSAYVSYSSFTASSPHDFIPAMRYRNGFPQTAENVEYVPDTYVNKFTSKGFILGVKYSFMFVMVKPKNLERPRSLYFKGTEMVMYNNQKYTFHAMSDSLNNPQFNEFQSGISLSANFLFNLSLVYDSGKFIIGSGCTYYSIVYGNNNGSFLESNHARDFRFTTNAFIYYRLGFEKFVNGVDRMKNKIR